MVSTADHRCLCCASNDRNKLVIKSTWCHGFRSDPAHYCSVTTVMFCDTKVLSILLYLLLLHRNGSATECPAGQKVNYSTKKCENCPKGQFRPTAGKSIHCTNCAICQKGNEEVSKCTPTSNTQCRCMQGFTVVDGPKQKSCTCKKGSGVDQTGKICKTCLDGFFTDKDNMSCQKWKECKSGVEIQGTDTSDVVCKNASAEVTEAPKIIITLFRTTKTASAAPSTTTATLKTTATLRTTTYPLGGKTEIIYIIGVVIICAGILLLAGLLYCKSKFTHCIQNNKKVDSRKESIYRKPVEESGEKCLSLLVYNSF